MGEIFKKIKMPLIVIVIAFIGYVAYSSYSARSNAATNGSSATSTKDKIGQDFIVLLNQLKQIKLDDSIFSDPVFKSLSDKGVPIQKEDKGRPNPFSPIGYDIASAPATDANAPADAQFEFSTDAPTTATTPTTTTKTPAKTPIKIQ